MFARRSSFPLNPLLVAAFLAFLPPLAHAGMIGTGVSPRAIAIGDLNEDGFADLVSGDHNDSTVTVMLGRGNGRFRPKVQYRCGSYVYAIALADLNGDNHLDVVNCCSTINKVGVRFGAGDGTLGARTDYSANQPQGVVARDLTGDGLKDIAVVGLAQLTTLIATSPGIFNPVVQGAANATSLDAGDVDGDGDPDIVTANLGGNGALLYFNLSPGVFSAPTNLALQAAATSVVLADFNHDGTLDLAATVPNFAAVNVRLGTGGGTFAPLTTYPTAATPLAMASADLNGDTHLDLIVPSPPGNTVAVLRGTGSGTFLPRTDFAAGVNPQAVAASRLDGDANPDLAIAIFGQNSIATLPGNGDGTFQVPSGPVYVWANAVGNVFDPNAWLPARNTNSGTDVLVFNRGGAVTVNSVPTVSIGQFVVSGGTQASITGLGIATLTIAGGTGDDGVVEEESKMILASSGSPLLVNMAAGTRANIYGDVEIRGGSNRLQALDAGGIQFQSNGRAIIGPGSTTTPFGNGTGASGDRSVSFLSGSQYIAQTQVAVFGTTPYPAQLVTFAPGSRFRQDAAFNQDVANRLFGDFEYNATGGSSLTGNGTWTVDSLIVSQGTLSVEVNNGITIQGNIVVGVCSPNQLRFLPPTPQTYHLLASGPRVIRGTGACGLRMYASANVTWNINNPAGVRFTQPWRTVSNFNFTQGNLGNYSNWQLIADSTSTFTGASQSTGWVESFLTRRAASSGPFRLDIGDANHYLPMDLVINGLTAPGYVTAGTFPFDHQELWAAQLDPSHLVHRTWTVTASNDALNGQDPTFFNSADMTFAFLPSDVDPGSDPQQFVVRQDRPAYAQWLATTTGVRTATSTQALGITAALIRSHEHFAVGQPITPSLSVASASSAEGNGPGIVVPVPEVRAAIHEPVESAVMDGVEVTAPWRTTIASTRSVAIAPMRVQSAGSLAFRVRLSQAAIVPVSVDYQTVDGTATAADGDYTPTSGTLNFAAGDTALDIVVPFGADATPERNETFGITLANASNATIDTPAATGTIVDDDDLIAPTAQVTYPNGGEVIHQNQQVTLQWSASDNVAVSGVDIQLVDGANVTTLAGNYPNTGSYSWLSTGPASTTMKFRVVAHDDPGHVTTDNSDANWEISPYIIGVDDEVPVAFALPAPSPNPSPAGSSRITFAVPHAAQVRLTVHDVRGRTVATLANGVFPAGRHVRLWDSSAAGAGVYFLHLEAPGFRGDQRMVVVR